MERYYIENWVVLIDFLGTVGVFDTERKIGSFADEFSEFLDEYGINTDFLDSVYTLGYDMIFTEENYNDNIEEIEGDNF